jgi:hypothetical protein
MLINSFSLRGIKFFFKCPTLLEANEHLLRIEEGGCDLRISSMDEGEMCHEIGNREDKAKKATVSLFRHLSSVM